MSITKLNEAIFSKTLNRKATINELHKEGLIEFNEVKMRARNDAGVRIAYIANLKGTQIGWEISKLAYLSKTKQSINFNLTSA